MESQFFPWHWLGTVMHGTPAKNLRAMLPRWIKSQRFPAKLRMESGGLEAVSVPPKYAGPPPPKALIAPTHIPTYLHAKGSEVVRISYPPARLPSH